MARVVLLLVACAMLATTGDARRAHHHPRSSSASFLRQDLGGSGWTYSNKNGTVVGAANVPSTVHTDLMASGVLKGDPLFRDNEALWRWVAYDEWTYTTTFDLAPGLAAFDSVQLQADGIDTISEIALNGQVIGGTDNMHLKFIFEVKSLLKGKANELRITLFSPLKEGLEAAEAYPYEVPTLDAPSYLPNRNFLRKAQSDSGWDWGPGFAPSGIWQPIGLVGSSSSRFMSVVVHQYPASSMDEERAAAMDLADGDVLLRVTSNFQVIHPIGGSVCATIVVGSGTISNCTTQTLTSIDVLGEYATDVLLTVRAADVRLWWPNGYGEQPLFAVQATYTDASGAVTDSMTRSIGFKTVELVREAGPASAGQRGRSFYFKVNSVPIYVKGANMIPADVFHSRLSDFDLTLSLSSLLETGGNLVRIWGGGIYQRDALYEYASRHGLLIWQEFAFACAMYPRDDAFLASVRREVAYQTRRFSSYVGMLVFGGNNENEAALTWSPMLVAQRDIYLVDYVKLYIDTVRDQLRVEVADTLPFVSSSPSRGPQSETPYTQLWGAAMAPDFGDYHYYNYVDDCTDLTVLPRARFISEFGHQSLPSMFSWADVTSPEDWSWNSTMMEYRQRHPSGNDQLRAQMAMHFQLPNASDPVQQFDDWAYTTQAVQSLCYRTAFQHWRRIKQETLNGSGRTMGIIYWQLNDIWQAPTWSGLEHSGRWKMLHYVVKRSFSPLLASGYFDPATQKINIYLTSDLNHPLTVDLTFTVNSWSSGRKATSTQTFNLVALESSRVVTLDTAETFKSAGCLSLAECYMMVAATSSDNSVASPWSEIFVAPLRDSPLLPPVFTLGQFAAGPSAECGSDQAALTCATFVLSSSEAAAYVFVETPLFGRFDDNGFVLARGDQRTLTFSAFDPERPFALADLQANIKARSIRGTYEAEADEQLEH